MEWRFCTPVHVACHILPDDAPAIVLRVILGGIAEELMVLAIRA